MSQQCNCEASILAFSLMVKLEHLNCLEAHILQSATAVPESKQEDKKIGISTILETPEAPEGRAFYLVKEAKYTYSFPALALPSLSSPLISLGCASQALCHS